MTIAAAYYAGKVLRWHANPAVSVVRQTNADHVAGCLTLLFKLVPEPSINLVRAIVFHDIGEKVTGDLPNTFKERFPDTALKVRVIERDVANVLAGCNFLDPLNNIELALLRLVDRMEAFAHVAVFFPAELAYGGWNVDIEYILNLSNVVGLYKQVAEFIGDMKLRRFDLPEVR